MMAKLISVVIVTYNSESFIYDCLDSLLKYNDIGDALEVLVVDNCSSGFDRMSACILKKYGKKVRIIKNNHNGGYGQGNNVGIRESSAPYIMIMNPDVRICNPIFKTIYELFTYDSSVVQVGIKQMLPGRKVGYSFSWKSTIVPYISLPLIYLTKRLDVYFPKYMYFAGSCFFLRKSSFEEVGLFDENIFLYHEEEDIHLRLERLPHAKFVYWNKGLYEHLHLPSKRVDDEKLQGVKRSFYSLKYLYNREGYGENMAYQREIQKCRLFLFREKILCLLGKGSDEYYRYLKSWYECLIERSV